MMKNTKIDRVLCAFADGVLSDGKSVFTWGEKEIPESLKEKYERVQEEKRDEEV